MNEVRAASGLSTMAGNAMPVIQAGPPRASVLGSGGDTAPTLSDLMRIVWRYRWPAAALTGVVFLLSLLLVLQLNPRYRATALVAIDTRQIQFSDVSAVVSAPVNAADPMISRSEVSILESEELTRAVVRDLGLDTLDEFAPRKPLLADLRNTVADLLGWQERAPASDVQDPRFEAAVEAYRKALTVFNDGRSFVIAVSFQSRDRALAARVANRHAEIYIERQRAAKDRALLSATQWLGREVDGLSQRLRAAEAAVQLYREENRLFSAGGTSLIQQQLTEANAELARVRSDLMLREARLRRAMINPAEAIASTEVVASDALSRLRDQELVARRRLAELEATLDRGRLSARIEDRNNPGLAQLRAGLAAIQGLIAEETGKIVRSLSSEAEIARLREVDARTSLAHIETLAASEARSEAGARDLEREAVALRSLYESLLARQKQVATQVGIQQPDAQIASRAAEPFNAAFPNRPLFLLVALGVAMMLGTALALLLNRRRTGVETIDELEAATGTGAIAWLPRLKGRTARRTPLALAAQAASEPRSLAAEAVRTLRTALAARGGGTPRVLAVTSSLPGEGKTSVSLALARSLAASGLHVLLVDADLRRGALARSLWGRDVDRGTVAVLAGRAQLAEVAKSDPVNPALQVLAAEPGGGPVDQAIGAPADLLEAGRLQNLLRTARGAYDAVVVDTPPLGRVADALLIGRAVDTTLVVVRAENTPMQAVTTTLRALAEAGVAVAGLALNAADPRRGGREAYGFVPLAAGPVVVRSVPAPLAEQHRA